jgi:hypothetical protein
MMMKRRLKMEVNELTEEDRLDYVIHSSEINDRGGFLMIAKSVMISSMEIMMLLDGLIEAFEDYRDETSDNPECGAAPKSSTFSVLSF